MPRNSIPQGTYPIVPNDHIIYNQPVSARNSVGSTMPPFYTPSQFKQPFIIN